MRPDYSLLPQLEAITTETGRTYSVVGHPEIAPMRSITTALSLTADKSGLERWKERVGHDEAKRVSKEATDRGTLVHAFMEASFGVSLSDPTQDQERAVASSIADLVALNDGDVGLNMAKNLASEIRKHMVEPEAQELAVYSEELLVAGRFDAVGFWKGKRAVFDWKTSRKPKREEWITDYRLQVAYYGYALNELLRLLNLIDPQEPPIDTTVIGITCETGDVQIFESTVSEWLPMLRHRLSLLPTLTP